jgi:hypothetical protein
MIARSFDPIAELQSAFNVLTKNWVLAAIPTVGLLICFALFAMVFMASGGFAILSGGLNDLSTLLTVLGGALVGVCIAGLISIVVMSIAHAAVVVAAKDVWDGRTPNVGSAITRALSRVADIILAGFSIAIICIAISWTFIGPLALIFLMIYVYPAIIVGGESAFAAMGTSWRMSTQNAGPTFGAFLGILVFWIAGAIVNVILQHIPIIGTIASLFLNGFISAFGALVIVRFFDLLKAGTAGTQMVTPSSPPPPVV